MKETWNNLKKVYSFGKEYKKNMIVFTVSSFFAIIINVIYPFKLTFFITTKNK